MDMQEMKDELQAIKKAISSEPGAYVPDFERIAQVLGLTSGTINDEKMVQVPVQLFKHLLTGWLINQQFDETAYLEANPDVAQAVREGSIDSAWSHYLLTGYYEGRKPGAYFVDPKYYRRTYPDVALAERKGQTTVSEHYNNAGRAEHRDPCEAHAIMARIWRRSLAR